MSSGWGSTAWDSFMHGILPGVASSGALGSTAQTAGQASDIAIDAAGSVATAGASTAATTGTAASEAASAGSTAASSVTTTGSAAAAAGITAAHSTSIATTLSEASAVASSASALYSLANGPGRINVPPAPSTGLSSDQAQVDQQQQELRRQQVAGGLQGTTGTSGGQSGAILNPGTVSNRSVLGG